MDKHIEVFFLQYNEEFYNNAMTLREIVLANLPGVIEQLDLLK
jgi:hypothetical protein